jgi:hypothetical protein
MHPRLDDANHVGCRITMLLARRARDDKKPAMSAGRTRHAKKKAGLEIIPEARAFLRPDQQSW